MSNDTPLPVTALVANPFLSNRAYDVLKYIVQIFLPALSALYFGLAQIWGFPNAEQVVGTIALITVFLGAVLLLSSRQYNNSDAKYDGELLVIPEADKDVYRFQVNLPLEELAKRKDLSFRIDKQ
jgi:hypothetical protein